MTIYISSPFPVSWSLGRAAVVGEYYVAEIPMTLAAVMHFRVAPLTQEQGLGRGNDSSSTVVGDGSDRTGADGVVAGKDTTGVAVVSSLDLAGYDVLDLPLGSSPQAMYLHSSPLSLVCMTATTTASTTVATTTVNSKGTILNTKNNLTPIRTLADTSPTPSLSLLNGGLRFHDRFSQHVEELLGDRYLRAMRGQPPEGDGPEEVDDDE